MSQAAALVTIPNACKTAANPGVNVQIPVDESGTSPASVAPGQVFSPGGITETLNVPGAVFVTGYQLGLLPVGPNTIPADGQMLIDGSNTVEGSQLTALATGSISTVISDPDGIPGTADDSATDGSITLNYPAQTWTAGASGTINFKEHTDTAITGLAGGGVRVTAHIPGGLNVPFHCSPGTVDPVTNAITFIDPADPFASTNIVPNTAPTANAGPDQTVNEGDLVNLDGTGSSDPDPGDTLTYAWTQSSGPSVTLSGANTATPSFTAPNVSANTDLTFDLQVCDNHAACNTDSVTVTDQNVNHAPTSNAGPDQTVNENTLVNLNGTGSSDPDGDALTYAWTQSGGPSVTLSGANTATPSFTAPDVTADTDLTFDLQVCDPAPLCNTDSVTIHVLNVAVPVPDASMNVIVNGPTSTRAGDKTVVAKITNLGTASVPVCDTDISWNIMVNGSPTTGSVSPLNPGCKTLGPGGSTRFRFNWTYGAGEVSAGATVDYMATVTVAGDAVPGNDSDTETRTAK